MQIVLSSHQKTLTGCIQLMKEKGFSQLEWEIDSEIVASYLSLLDGQEKMNAAKKLLKQSKCNLYGLAIQVSSFDAASALFARQSVDLAKKLGARSLFIALETGSIPVLPQQKRLKNSDLSLMRSGILTGAAPFLSRLASYAAHSAGGCGYESPSLMLSYDFSETVLHQELNGFNDQIGRYNCGFSYEFERWFENQSDGHDEFFDSINHFEASIFRAVIKDLPVQETFQEFLTDLTSVYDGALVVENAAISLEDVSVIASQYDLPADSYDTTGMSYPSSSKRILKSFGSFRLDNDSPVTVNDFCSWTLSYTVDAQGIAPGGGIKFRFHHSTNTGMFQLTNPHAAGFCSVQAAGVLCAASIISEDACRVILCEFPDGLLPGEEIMVRIGDTSGGAPGIQAQKFQQSDFTFFLAVDPTGLGRFFEHPNPPKIEIIGKTAKKIKVVAPSVVRENEPFCVHIRVEDDLHNCAVGYIGKLSAYWENSQIDCGPVIGDEHYSNIFHVFDASCLQAGIDRIVVRNEQGLEGKSNYIECSHTASKLFWGDIHGHTALMDSVSTPEQYLTYGRDKAFLDFCSLSEHMDGSADETFTCHDIQWALLMEVTKQFHHPGKFVTILGYENSTSFWDANVYFPGDQAPWAVFRFPDALFAFAKEHQAMVIPHMTTYPQFQRGYNWAFYDPEVVPLMEIYSTHGASEYFGGERPLMNCEPGGYALDALTKGHQIGFMAAGDGHDGMPGNSPWGRYINGLTAVYSDDLTREGVLDALWKRRCYGTTNERILVKFKANQFEMGEKFEIVENELVALSFQIYATDEIDEVIIVSDGHFVSVETGNGSKYQGKYSDTPAVGPHYYYVKMRQKNGEMLWTSPVFVNVKKANDD